MKLLPLFAVCSLLFVLTGCPQKKMDAGETSSEPVEGASSTQSESSESGASQEMQENKDAKPEAPIPGDPTKEEKK